MSTDTIEAKTRDIQSLPSENVPAIIGSSNFVIFFNLRQDELDLGSFLQGDGGRLFMKSPIEVPGYEGKTVYLPDISYEPRGAVVISREEKRLYVGVPGIERFLQEFPSFETYRPHFDAIIGGNCLCSIDSPKVVAVA